MSLLPSVLSWAAVPRRGTRVLHVASQLGNTGLDSCYTAFNGCTSVSICSAVTIQIYLLSSPIVSPSLSVVVV
jgi:hypothetical protein